MTSIKPKNKALLIKPCLLLVNWNCSEHIISRISELGPTYPIIVINNNSPDFWKIQEFLARSDFKVPVISLDSNLGYGGGMNAGMREAKRLGFQFALLLNPDSVPSVKQIDLMFNYCSSFDVVGIQQYKIDEFGNRVTYPCAAKFKKRGFSALPDVNVEILQVDVVTGAAILVDLNFAERVGFIDEKYFHYKEEFDFTYRMGLEGARIGIVGAEPLFHLSGQSLSQRSKTASYYSIRNEILFIRSLDQLTRISKIRITLVCVLDRFKQAGISHFAPIMQGLAHGAKNQGGRR